MTISLPAIRLDSISKSFGQVQANRNITLEIQKGRIFCFLGENGAGKSTLMSMLSGHLEPDSGQIFVGGEAVCLNSPEDAILTGIGIVGQELKLVESMTVAENIFLSGSKSFFLSKKKIIKQVMALAKEHGVKVDPGKDVAELSMGEKQQVEILKLLHQKSDVFLFDESTSLLTPQEVSNQFSIMRSMASKGKTIIFISHKLEEVIAVSDDVAILRRGQLIDIIETKKITSLKSLAERMVEREMHLEIDRVPLTPKQIILSAEQLCSDGLKDVNFKLRKGEILSIVGMAGNGQRSLVKLITGGKRLGKGRLDILGDESNVFFANRSWDDSLSYIPEDRQGVATSADLDIVDNFLLTTGNGFSDGIWLDKEKAREKVQQLIEDFDIQTQGPDSLAGELSGGNLQKMVIARAFYCKPRLMIIEQPTQGLDISATQDVWELLLKAREQAGLLIITSNLSEALTLSDRIAVMYGGRIVDTFSSDNVEKVNKISQMMVGLSV